LGSEKQNEKVFHIANQDGGDRKSSGKVFYLKSDSHNGRTKPILAVSYIGGIIFSSLCRDEPTTGYIEKTTLKISFFYPRIPYPPHTIAL